ncbi:unnamed protein product [Heligmosomoides polygyrus]|uniref:LAM_G_DOMAIN domain-containing protein n=1 Tax=Heligmosomoides polygyrus TaxID=6339 RepID=A0A3P7TBJ5_HELPZ|nr:unnamed protein product [Heligmosomoides polygyrus]
MEVRTSEEKNGTRKGTCVRNRDVLCECSDVSFSATSAHLDGLKRVQRISVSGHIAAYAVEISISDGEFQTVYQSSGNPMYITAKAEIQAWNHVDFLASELRIKNAYGIEEKDFRNPLLMLTVCDNDSPITVFDDSSYMVDTHKAGLVSMYENELTVVFRSYRSGVLFFSVADQGDILIAQVVHGTVHVMFDFGSLSPSHVSAGRALDDGRWHELRWLHQFDSVQLAIDGVVLNQTTPTGLYRKLDFHNQIHVGGRPPDEFSEGIETSFTGCMARLQLNSVDLLSFAPRDEGHKCQMSRPPSLTLHDAARAFIPFSFLPFSFEFRILPVQSVLLDMLDAENRSLLQTTVDDDRTLHLVSNVTRFKQIAHPQIDVADGGWHSFSLRIRGARLEVEIDGYTVLWLEGQEVRRISARLALLLLSSIGCYRSTTIDFDKVYVEGTGIRGRCEMVDRLVFTFAAMLGSAFSTYLCL